MKQVTSSRRIMLLVTLGLAGAGLLAAACALQKRRQARAGSAATAASKVLTCPASRSDIEAAVSCILASASEKGWLAGLGSRVIIKLAFFPASVNAGLSSDPALVRALARALRVLKPDLHISLLTADSHGLSADMWLMSLGLAEVAQQEQFDIMRLPSEPAFWSHAPELPWSLPLPAVALEDAFFISLGRLALHPTERMIGMLYHHVGYLPGIWDECWDDRRHTAMAWAARLYPPHLCLLDGRHVVNWVGPTPAGYLDDGFLLCTPDPISADVATARLLKIPPVQVPALRAAKQVARALPDVELVDSVTHSVEAPAAGRAYYEARTLRLLDKIPLTLGQREQWTKKVTGSREPLTYLIPRVWRQMDAALAYWWRLERGWG